MTRSIATLEWLAFLALVTCLGLIQFTIFAENFLWIAGLIWLVLLWKDGRHPVPAFFWPLVAYAAVTLIGAAFGIDRLSSYERSRQMIIFLIVPVTARVARGYRATTAINVIIALGAIGAVIGVFQYAVLNYDNLGARPTGMLGHYMTYAGVMMLVLGAAIARLMFYVNQRSWPLVAVPALVAALAVTQARNAWMGALAAATALMAMRRAALVLVIPVVLLVGLAVAPSGIRHRALSIFDMSDVTTRDRLEMWKAGLHMIEDRPLAGVGMNNVMAAYPSYRTPQAIQEPRPHLHNVPIQIAAERGLPALGVWIWFVVVAARDLWRQARRGPAPAIAAAGVAAIVGMLVAGLFEYNFGDSEFLILFLGLISLPFAAAQPPSGPPAASARVAT